MKTRKTWKRSLGLIALALLAGALPVLVLGTQFEDRLTEWLQFRWSRGELAIIVIGLLSLDLLLPVPSSGVSTYAGAVLGFFPALFVNWLGTTVGAVVGFAAARWIGPRVMKRQVAASDWQQMQTLNWSVPWLLVLLRPLPILAEASVIFAGLEGVAWLPFLAAIAASNLVLGGIYAGMGAWAGEREGLAQILVLSVLIPIVLTGLLRRAWKRRRNRQFLKDASSKETEKASDESDCSR